MAQVLTVSLTPLPIAFVKKKTHPIASQSQEQPMDLLDVSCSAASYRIMSNGVKGWHQQLQNLASESISWWLVVLLDTKGARTIASMCSCLCGCGHQRYSSICYFRFAMHVVPFFLASIWIQAGEWKHLTNQMPRNPQLYSSRSKNLWKFKIWCVITHVPFPYC